MEKICLVNVTSCILLEEYRCLESTLRPPLSFCLDVLEIVLSWCTGDRIVLVYWRSFCFGVLEIALSWCTGDRIVLLYWRSYCLGVLEIVLSWCTGDRIVLVYWRSYFLGVLEIVLSWCTGECTVPGDVGGAVLSDYTASHATRQRYSKSVQYSDLILINLRGFRFTCKGKLSRGDCSSLPERQFMRNGSFPKYYPTGEQAKVQDVCGLGSQTM
jgi:hypothetical protein